MAHDVFISHSAKDKTVADAVCATLESNGIRCWIAPRDILPGQDWGTAIVTAIARSRAMILVFSSHANASGHIRREVERSVKYGLPIIPFRIENVAPCRSLEYFIDTHWLDAFTPPLRRHIEHLAAVVAGVLKANSVSEEKEPLPTGNREIVEPVVTPLPVNHAHSTDVEEKTELASGTDLEAVDLAARTADCASGAADPNADGMEQRKQPRIALWVAGVWLCVAGLFLLTQYLSGPDGGARPPVPAVQQVVAPPTERFETLQCGAILDRKTGLQWYVGPDIDMDWLDAAGWVVELTDCGGHWSQPTSEQLETLYDPHSTAGTGYLAETGEHWPAHINAKFASIGGGSWVWAEMPCSGKGRHSAVNFNQGISVCLPATGSKLAVRGFAVKK